MFSRLSEFTEQTLKEMRGTLEQNLTWKLKHISVAWFSGITEENAVGTPRKRKKIGWENVKRALGKQTCRPEKG